MCRLIHLVKNSGTSLKCDPGIKNGHTQNIHYKTNSICMKKIKFDFYYLRH